SAGILGQEAPAQGIRAWLHRDDNQIALRGIRALNLRALHLTGVPQEIALFGGLQKLDLGNNLLTSLPAGTFDPLPRLRILHLDNNRLDTLTKGLFEKLTGLQ